MPGLDLRVSIARGLVAIGSLLSVISCGIGCAAKKPPPMAAPRADVSVTHYAGTALTGPVAPGASPAVPRPQPAVSVEVKWLALERVPGGAGAEGLVPVGADARLVLDALDMALWHRDHGGPPVSAGLIHHSDAGSQYTSIRLTERLEAGVDPSVGSVGDVYDNALAESTIGSFKTEQINRNGPWRDVNHVEVATFEWVDFFNTVRPHEYLDDLTPVEAEKLHYARFTALPATG
jgi:hypothetical protein